MSSPASEYDVDFISRNPWAFPRGTIAKFPFSKMAGVRIGDQTIASSCGGFPIFFSYKIVPVETFNGVTMREMKSRIDASA
jgi:hypothetical protein